MRRKSVPEVTRAIGIESVKPVKGPAMQVPAFARDLAERAVKTFAYSMIGALPTTAVSTSVVGVPWLAAASIAASATVLSVLGSLASLKFGNSGTASLTTAVEPAS